jgi:hypothetical protein
MHAHSPELKSLYPKAVGLKTMTENPRIQKIACPYFQTNADTKGSNQ